VYDAGRRIGSHAAVNEGKLNSAAGEPVAIPIFEPGRERPARQVVRHRPIPTPGAPVLFLVRLRPAEPPAISVPK